MFSSICILSFVVVVVVWRSYLCSSPLSLILVLGAPLKHRQMMENGEWTLIEEKQLPLDQTRYVRANRPFVTLSSSSKESQLDNQSRMIPQQALKLLFLSVKPAHQEKELFLWKDFQTSITTRRRNHSTSPYLSTRSTATPALRIPQRKEPIRTTSVATSKWLLRISYHFSYDDDNYSWKQ